MTVYSAPPSGCYALCRWSALSPFVTHCTSAIGAQGTRCTFDGNAINENFRKRAIAAAVTVVTLSSLFNAVRFWEFTIGSVGQPQPWLRAEPMYQLWYVAVVEVVRRKRTFKVRKRGNDRHTIRSAIGVAPCL